jgi:hypothetical protein
MLIEKKRLRDYFVSPTIKTENERRKGTAAPNYASSFLMRNFMSPLNTTVSS